MPHPTSRIMYIECKQDSIDAPGRIGRVTFSKSGKSIYYKGKLFKSLAGTGWKANYYDVESGADYWISGPKKRGGDRLYGVGNVYIDEDVQEEYWMKIRNRPGMVGTLIVK